MELNTQTVWIALISTGQYEDHSLTIDAVFDNKEQAEKHCEFIREHYKNLGDAPAPYDEADYMEGKLTEEQDAEYARWQSVIYESYEFNSATVNEFSVNSIAKSTLQNK